MDFRSQLDALPRLPLAVTPTPLRRLQALERALSAGLGRAVPRILIKHDDMTGFGLGGNKVRKLEHELAPPRLEGVTCLITTGGPQSNHARVTAAAAAWLGLDCALVVNGSAAEPPRANAWLMRHFGARIQTVSDRAERAPAMERIALEVAQQGGRALIVPLGASTAVGALGYARAFVELDGQLEPSGRPTHVFVSSSSGGTLAGLHLGQGLCERSDIVIVAVSADTPAPELRATAESMALGAAQLLGREVELPAERLEVRDDQVGPGYGQPTEASQRAADLFGRFGGVVVDQTYTAKAAAGLIHAIEAGAIDAEERVLFWHTGGWPSALP